MKAGWAEVTLDDVCWVQSGAGFPKKFQGQTEGHFPFFKVSDMNLRGNEENFSVANNYITEDVRSTLGAKIFPPGSVVFPKVGGAIATNKKRKVIQQSCVDNNIMGLIPDTSKINSDFIYHWIQAQDIYEFSNKANPPSITQTTVKGWPFLLPPLEEQKRIVAVLDEAFAALDRARTHAETNLKNARELFESFLGSHFSSSANDWETHSVGELVEQGIIGKPLDGNHGEIHPKKSDFVEFGVPFVMASDLVGGAVNQETCHFISEEQANGLRKGFAKDGDILLSHKGTIGRAAMLTTRHDFVVLTPQVTYYRVLEPKKLISEFLYFLFLSAPFQKEMALAAGDGATRAYIGITKQLALKVSFPNVEAQTELLSTFREVQTKSADLIARYQMQISDLDDLRQSLLQKAFSGELT